MSYDTFEVILEKKGRGKGFSFARPWTIRTFKLKGQNLEYWDKDVMKGTIAIKGSATGIISTADADGREFGFAINTGEEKVILNASSSVLREQCMERFNAAANDPDWAKRRTKEDKDYEKAATKAVAGMFSEDAEKARLKAQEAALEKDRQQEVSAGAAGVFQEGLADKALEEAKIAEAEQLRQQQAEIAGLLGQANAKKRFREALARGQMRVAKDAAATMLQGAWKVKLAARAVLRKKAEKERLRKDGYARKIQSRYRMRLARKKIQRIKAEKRAIHERLCALRVQSRWRIYLARKAYRKKQEAKLRAEFAKSVGKSRGLITLQNVVRAFLSKRRVAKIRVQQPTVVTGQVLKVEGLPSSASADVAAVFSGVYLDLPLDHPLSYRKHVVIADDVIKVSARVGSNYKVENPAGAHTAMITTPRRMDYVAVTFYDRGNKDEFLGQALVRLSEIEKDYSGTGNHTVELTVPLSAKLNVHIPTEAGSQLVNVRRAGSGVVQLSLTLQDPATSICGAIYKVSESMLSNAWKKRWFVLSNGLLHYFNSELALENTKNFVIMRNVTSIKMETYKGREGIKLSFPVEGKESNWMIDFDEAATPLVKRMWLRRLYRNTPQVPDPALEKFRTRLDILTVSNSGASAASAVSPTSKTKTPMSKRMSIFS